jgi:hypothetical protein
VSSDPTWRSIVEKAKSYLDIGQSEIYLHNDANDYPWEFAQGCTPGGSHRLDISTSVRFFGEHPSGLRFSWSFDIEPYSANGSGSYHLDREGIASALAKLDRTPAAEQFRAYLRECVTKVSAKGDEYQAVANRQYADAQLLRAIAGGAA